MHDVIQKLNTLTMSKRAASQSLCKLGFLMSGDKSKRRWFFPVKSLKDADEAIRIAWEAALALAVLQGILHAFLILYSGKYSANVFDSFFLVGLGWAIRYRRSRTAAVILLVYSLFVGFITLSARIGTPVAGSEGKNIILAALLIYASYTA